MAPASSAQDYKVGDKVLCFHGELLYEAKIEEAEHEIPNDRKSALKYKVHYKGWKKTWDDWVPVTRIRKDSTENRELALSLRNLYTGAKSAPSKGEADGTNGEKPSRKRQRDNETETEDDFLRRPEVRLPIPDHLKAILVDDWENVTKNLELVKLPSKHPVNEVLDVYFDEEKQKRRPGSADIDLLEEVIAGFKSYFAKALGRILLYTFERQQYQDLRARWEGARAGDKWDGKGPGDCYGPEHLLRLIVKLPELVAQTNMDKQAIDRLREETTKLCLWLARHSGTYFDSPYEKASPEYQELHPARPREQRRK